MRCPFDKSDADCYSIEKMGKNYALLDLLEAEKNKSSNPGEKYCTTHQN